MKAYYVMFYTGPKAICGTWQRAQNKEEACELACYRLIAHYPNVKFTDCKITDEAE